MLKTSEKPIARKWTWEKVSKQIYFNHIILSIDFDDKSTEHSSFIFFTYVYDVTNLNQPKPLV